MPSDLRQMREECEKNISEYKFTQNWKMRKLHVTIRIILVFVVNLSL